MIVASHVEMLPFTSVTVIVTVFVPTSVQSKFVSLSVMVSIPQLSLELLFTSATEIDPLPDPSSVTVTLLQLAIGAKSSTIVTVAVHVDEFELESVTVKDTVFAPTFEQSNEVVLAANVIVPQLSLDPPSMSAATIVALPLASRLTVIS